MRNRQGFTIIEVTVAMGVTMLLVALMIQMLSQSSAIWNHSNESLDTFREARAALQNMSRELGSLRAMPLVKQTYPLLALQHHPDASDEEQGNQEVYMLVNTRNSGAADHCAVGYYCRWNAKLKTFTLARQMTPSDATFKNLGKVLKASAPLTGPPAFLALYSRPASEAEGSVDDVATYLWDLKFVLPDTVTYDSGQQAGFPQGIFSQKLPPWIEIRCKALGSLSARRLAGAAITPETWMDETTPLYRNLILPHQQQFVTRVSFVQ